MEAPTSGSLGAMSSLLGKLEHLLKSQHLSRNPVRKDIELLKENLDRINTFLLELSNEDDPNHTKKYWMKEVREVSYDIEDYIDRLMYSEAKIGSIGVVPRLKISKLPSTLQRRPKIANQIHKLLSRLEDAAERHTRYVLDNNTLSSCSYVPYGCCSIATQHGKASRLLLVGINDSREKLIKLLNDGEKQLKLISVFGIGGIGKTTLVKQLFQSHAGQFRFRAFVKASRKPDTRSVLRSIISQTRCHHYFDACSVQELIACLNEHLQNRRYLIVIDDLWDTTVWDILLCAFPDGNHSSRIITTTSVKNVAMTCCSDWSDYGLMMEPLNMDDSRKLFFTRVFGSEDKFPQQFKDASYEIVRNCGGVPLAIINIAGFLASQPDKPDLWDYVQKSLNSNLSICPTTEGIVNVINLGYNGLPLCLKTCLQYVTLYPENCTICKDDLVRRWVAEGFISPKEGNDDMEAVAESYFEELVDRGMIQPAYINYNDEVLSCTVHNLVLDLLIQKSTEDNFITTIDYSKNNRELSNKIRRLFLFFSTVKYATKPSGVTLSQVRSLSYYGLIKCMPSIMEFEFLRVLFLHFSGDYSGHTPFNLTGIRRLFQLRYLKVTCNFSLQLPTHIEGLYHLETLELDAKVTPLPADITYLHHLLHLRLPSKTNLPDEIGRMRSLRTLKCIDLCSNLEDKVRSLEELTNLQELQLICTTVPSDCSLDRNLNVMCSILGSFCNLKSLALDPGYSVTCSSSTSVIIDSSSTSSPPVCLERFEIHPAICVFSGFPQWMRTLRRLCILKIAVTEFLQDDMNNLGGLPGLTVLTLYIRKPAVEPIVFNSGAFPALKYFKFRCMILHFVFLEESMPNLRRLKICFKTDRGLIMLAGIVHLLNLQEVAVRIGLPTGEYNRQAADSASKVAEPWFKVAIGENRRIPNMNIQYVKWQDEDDYVPAWNIIESTSDIDDGLLDKTLHYDTNKKSDSRISKFSDMTISFSDLLSSAADNKEHPTKSESAIAANVMGMVSSTKSDIHEMPIINDISSYASVEIDQVFKAADLEHKQVSSKQQGKIQHEKYNDGSREATPQKYMDTASALNERPVIEFSYREIEEASKQFHYSHKISEGESRTVYKGHLHYTDVAIKILRPQGDFSQLRGDNDDFDQEVQALSRIRHPNLVTLIGVCPQAKALIYEFFPNGSLEDLLRRRNNTEQPLSWKTRIRIAVDICRALLFLHSCKPKGVVHGNLNPGSIYLDDNYVAKLGSFHYQLMNPLVRRKKKCSPLTRFRQEEDTIGYKDPMYFKTRELTAESDVYSFGMVLARLLTYKRPNGEISLQMMKLTGSAIETGRLQYHAEKLARWQLELLGPPSEDWPPHYAQRLMILAEGCCHYDRKERPDLANEIWPVLRTMLEEVTRPSTSLHIPDNKWEPASQFTTTTKDIGGYTLGSGKEKTDELKNQRRRFG